MIAAERGRFVLRLSAVAATAHRLAVPSEWVRGREGRAPQARRLALTLSSSSSRLS